MDPTLRILQPQQVTPAEREAILSLCSAAYEMDFAPYLAALHAPIHLLLSVDGHLVSHAALVTRRLIADGRINLQTAYVEAVATAPAHQGRGYGTRIMAAVAATVADPAHGHFDLAALSPSDAGFYARLGWELWQGPLRVRTDAGELPTPEEEVMILRLPATPSLDPTASLSCEWRPLEIW